MRECLLCERDMTKSRSTFGNGCTNNIFKFLNIEKPKRCRNKEQVLYKNIMELTKVSKVNEKQKIWLTDRYLTYEYLRRLHYGNFEKLKKQVKQDIENISRTEKFDELITAQKIRLKEAYDLYKRERKFEDSLRKIGVNSNYKENEKIKLIISGFNYIFNMYKNKKQYDKDSLKMMQYAFWQTVIEVGERYFNYELAAILLQHSLEENPQDFIVKDEQLIQMIRQDANLKNKIKEIIYKNKGKSEIYIPFGQEFVTFENNDLYFAIHHADIEMKAKRETDSNWNIEITLSDTFDFTKWKMPFEYYFDANDIPKSILSSTLYNLAFISQKLGVIKEYQVIAKLTIKLPKIEN